MKGNSGYDTGKRSASTHAIAEGTTIVYRILVSSWKLAAPRKAEMKRKSLERVFGVKQVAAMCHVSNETIRRWIRKYGLPAYNTQHALTIKTVESDLRDFAERMKVYVDWGAR